MLILFKLLDSFLQNRDFFFGTFLRSFLKADIKSYMIKVYEAKAFTAIRLETNELILRTV